MILQTYLLTLHCVERCYFIFIGYNLKNSRRRHVRNQLWFSTIYFQRLLIYLH